MTPVRAANLGPAKRRLAAAPVALVANQGRLEAAARRSAILCSVLAAAWELRGRGHGQALD